MTATTTSYSNSIGFGIVVSKREFENSAECFIWKREKDACFQEDEGGKHVFFSRQTQSVPKYIFPFSRLQTNGTEHINDSIRIRIRYYFYIYIDIGVQNVTAMCMHLCHTYSTQFVCKIVTCKLSHSNLLGELSVIHFELKFYFYFNFVFRFCFSFVWPAPPCDVRLGFDCTLYPNHHSKYNRAFITTTCNAPSTICSYLITIHCDQWLLSVCSLVSIFRAAFLVHIDDDLLISIYLLLPFFRWLSVYCLVGECKKTDDNVFVMWQTAIEFFE